MALHAAPPVPSRLIPAQPLRWLMSGMRGVSHPLRGHSLRGVSHSAWGAPISDRLATPVLTAPLPRLHPGCATPTRPPPERKKEHPPPPPPPPPPKPPLLLLLLLLVPLVPRAAAALLKRGRCATFGKSAPPGCRVEIILFAFRRHDPRGAEGATPAAAAGAANM
jgi:hypothetical protein